MWLRSKSKYTEGEIYLLIEALNNFRKNCFITDYEEEMCLELVSKLAKEIDLLFDTAIDI